MTKHAIGRRQLLAGAGVAVAAAATAGCAKSASSGGEGTWDQEADLVVVGSGAAAGTAAVIAAAEGAKVLMLEKMPITGGTTAKSGGVTWVFNHFVLKEQGIADPKEDALKYIVRYGYPREYDPASPTLGLDETRFKVAEAFYDHGSDAIDALRKLDAVQFKQFLMWGVNLPAPDYADHLPENKVPAGRALEPSAGAGATAGGGSLAKQLAAYLQKNQTPILMETRVTKIIKDGEGDRKSVV